jgi:hypothetical protein
MIAPRSRNTNSLDLFEPFVEATKSPTQFRVLEAAIFSWQTGRFA